MRPLPCRSAHLQRGPVMGIRSRLLWVGAAALTGLFVWLVWMDRGDHGFLDFDSTPLLTAIFALLMLVFPTLAIPVIKRQPGNPIGWLFYGSGVALALGLSAQVYSDLAIGGSSTSEPSCWFRSSPLSSPVKRLCRTSSLSSAPWRS